MASTMIGRTACPECGFASAHVKQSEKCVYRYCPECGAQHHARTERQKADLLAKTRTVDGAPTGSQPTPTPTPPEAKPEGEGKPTPTEAKPEAKPEAEATPTPTTTTPEAKPKRRGLFA